MKQKLVCIAGETCLPPHQASPNCLCIHNTAEQHSMPTKTSLLHSLCIGCSAQNLHIPGKGISLCCINLTLFCVYYQDIECGNSSSRRLYSCAEGGGNAIRREIKSQSMLKQNTDIQSFCISTF